MHFDCYSRQKSQFERILHIATTRNPNRLTIHIREVRTRNAENRSRRLLGARGSTKRDIGVRVGLGALLSIQLLAGNTQGNLGAVSSGDEGASLLGSRQTGSHVAEGDSVRADAESRAPFFGDGLGQADDAGFTDGVVCLASVIKI